MAMTKEELALAYKHQGNNCCQSVLLAFKEKTGLSETILQRLGSGFGGGMATTEETCGALCGAVMVAGLAATDKRTARKWAQQLQRRFKALSGATVCRVLKGIDSGQPLCSCEECVRYGVRIVEELDDTPQ